LIWPFVATTQIACFAPPLNPRRAKGTINFQLLGNFTPFYAE
jgi:hypothetical protein